LAYNQLGNYAEWVENLIQGTNYQKLDEEPLHMQEEGNKNLSCENINLPENTAEKIDHHSFVSVPTARSDIKMS